VFKSVGVAVQDIAAANRDLPLRNVWTLEPI
jgi:ornithine cyclodeaminase/alanine dehydrogenase-like protein (mu-crystallin family)